MLIAGLDIGGTKCAALLASVTGEGVDILSRTEIETEADWQAVCGRLIENLNMQAAAEGKAFADIRAVGISCGGPLDSGAGLILSPPNLPGWDNVPICATVTEKTGIPARLMNDADACAVAEWKLGAGKGTEHMIFLTFGTGLGAGLIVNGRLYTGASGMAGEAGHVRLSDTGPIGYGKAGSFEGFCSGGGIARQARAYFQAKLIAGERPPLCPDTESLDRLTAKNIAAAAFKNDADALEIYAQAGRNLGRGLAMLIDILNPEAIVMGGVFMRSHRLMTPAMNAVLEQECLPQSLAAVRILPAALGERIGDYGAIVAGIYKEKE